MSERLVSIVREISRRNLSLFFVFGVDRSERDLRSVCGSSMWCHRRDRTNISGDGKCGGLYKQRLTSPDRRAGETCPFHASPAQEPASGEGDHKYNKDTT